MGRPAKSRATDRSRLDEPAAGRLNIQYSPDQDTVLQENPPRFTWLPAIEPEAHYVLRVSSSKDFPDKDTLVFTGIELNFFTPDVVLDPGQKFWSYAVQDPKTGAQLTHWSTVRSFSLKADLPETPLAPRGSRYPDMRGKHPRLWLRGDTLKAARKAVADDPTAFAFDRFLEHSVKPWLDRDIMSEPDGYPDHKRVASIWRQTYIDCQELLYAIRHLAIGGRLTGDKSLTERAREWLIAAAKWNPKGTTSRAYTDEWAFRVNLALAWGYDWLHDELSEEERALVREALCERTRETAEHVIDHANIHLFPYDSHAVRAVSAVLVPASIALLDDEPMAETWLDYAVEFLMTVYSPWGDADGGWAEGPHYWMTGTAYLIDAANLLRNFSGIDLYRRPFFQHTGDFPFYTKPPDTRRATFGDDATMGDLPCLKIGYNLRQFAGVTGNRHLAWYHEEVKRNDPGTEMAFYNWGWWDFRFDEMVFLHDYGHVEPQAPTDIAALKSFRGIGWAAIQSRPDDPDRHIHFVFKSSPFGSISHSHGDQNAFCMAAFGEDLAIQSGHYIAFNSSMHQKWRRQTRSKNALLIDGNGQYAGKNKAKAIRSAGQLVEAKDRGDHIYIKGDATAAYRSLTPSVMSAVREVYFVDQAYFVFVDTVDAREPVEITWLLHTNEPMTLGSSTFRYEGKKAGFYGQFLWSEAGRPELGQQTGFADVDPQEIEGLPVSTCLRATFPKSARHRIATLLVPYRLAEPERIFTFLDDQGYDCDLYFTNAEEETFKVTVPKTFDVGR